MPRGDRTGPVGMGPKTGRGMGFCAGNEEPGYVNPSYGFGRMERRGGGRGRAWAPGMGRGRRFRNFPVDPPGWGSAPVMSQEDEISWLDAQARGLKESLAQLEKRLDTLKG